MVTFGVSEIDLLTARSFHALPLLSPEKTQKKAAELMGVPRPGFISGQPKLRFKNRE